EGVGRSSIQGDIRFTEVLQKMGAKISMGDDWIESSAPRRGKLKAIDADLNHIPDAAMTAAVAALFADGTSTLRNIASWRVKETDRLAAVATELRKLGAAGKGTVAEEVARTLGFHYLDSGALYRLVALAAAREGIDAGDEAKLAAIAARLPVRFEGEDIFLEDERVTDAIRTEENSFAASRVAGLPAVRRALLERQRSFRKPPGLVAEGRDMASIVFPDAALKVCLTASPEARAERRYKQL